MNTRTLFVVGGFLVAAAVWGTEPAAPLPAMLIGSPITLRIRHSLQPTATGKASLLSAIWTGGTLGLLPAITNNSFVVTYEIRVQGRDVATWSYQRNFTRAVNICTTWHPCWPHGLTRSSRMTQVSGRARFRETS